MAERFDRSAIDILLNGAEAEVRIPATRQAASKIRSDPALLPLDMVRTGTEEYHLFAPKRRPIVGPPPSMVGHHPPFSPIKEHLPRWIPSKIKWPLEDALSRLLGESPEQRLWLLQMEVSWPHGQQWYYGMGLWMLCPLLAWIAGMSQATILAGWLIGVVYGIFLRLRMEKSFDWRTEWVGLVGTFVAVCLVLHFSKVSPSWREWTVGAMLWKPLSGCLSAVKWPLVLYVSLGLPFYQDQKAVRYSNDVVVMSMFILTLVYAGNFCLPLGIWCGVLLKMVPPCTLPPLPPMLPPPGFVAAAGEGVQVPRMVKSMMDTPLQQQHQHQQQLQQQQLQYLQQQQQMQALFRQQDQYGMSPAAAAAAAAATAAATTTSTSVSPGLMAQSPQQQQQLMLKQQQWLLQQHLQQLQQPPMTEIESLRAAAAVLKQQQEGTSNHPRRWLKPEEEDYTYGSSSYTSMSPFPSGSYRRRNSLSGSLGAGGGRGAGGGEGGRLYGGGVSGSRIRWSGGGNGGGGGGQWGEEGGEGGQDEGRRYRLRSRRGRRGGGEEPEPTAMDLSSSPPPPTPMDTEDFGIGANSGMYGRRDGGGGGGRLGRYETLNPNH